MRCSKPQIAGCYFSTWHCSNRRRESLTPHPRQQLCEPSKEERMAVDHVVGALLHPPCVKTLQRRASVYVQTMMVTESYRFYTSLAVALAALCPICVSSTSRQAFDATMLMNTHSMLFSSISLSWHEICLTWSLLSIMAIYNDLAKQSKRLCLQLLSSSQNGPRRHLQQCGCIPKGIQP